MSDVEFWSERDGYPDEFVRVGDTEYVHWTSFSPQGGEPWTGAENNYRRFQAMQETLKTLVLHGLGIIPEIKRTDRDGKPIDDLQFYHLRALEHKEFAEYQRYLEERYPNTFDWTPRGGTGYTPMSPSEIAEAVNEALEATGLADKVEKLRDGLA